MIEVKHKRLNTRNVFVQRVQHNPDISVRFDNPVVCEHPHFILHPNLGEFLGHFCKYVMNGKEYSYRYSYRPLYSYDKSYFYSFIKSGQVTHKTIDDYYVLDELTGEHYPVFLEVKCGHCDICREAKANAFVHRCCLESQMYDVYPYFCTLTYDNAHLPKYGVSVEDCQKFMKRFRRRLEYYGFDDKIRYCIRSEYGPRTKRAHYHMIIWNFKPTVACDKLKLKQILQDAWQNGEVRRGRYFNPSETKTFYYTCKYMQKDVIGIPDTYHQPQMLSSRRHGGIGASFIDTIKPEFNRVLSPDFKYVNRFSGKLETLHLNSYTLNRLLPSFCRLIPSNFRSAVKRFVVNYHEYAMRVQFENLAIYKPQIINTYDNIRTNHRDQFYFPFDTTGSEFNGLSSGKDLASLLTEIDEDCIIIGKYSFSSDDYEKARKAQRVRQAFLDKLEVRSRVRCIDLEHRSYISRINRNRSVLNSFL